MATYTSNYAWAKPEGSDPVDIGVLNNNLDSQDNIVHNAYMQFAPVFSTASTYAVDDVVLYSNNLYKCITAVTVAGAWDSAKWTQVKVSDICGGGGGGGTSDYTQLTNKPSINSVTLSGNKTSADLGLQDAIQIDTMPTASATYVGKIVQFVGTTDATYTHGYYYECTTDGSTYSWVQTNVQPSSGSGGGHTIVNGAGTSMTQRDALQFKGGLAVSDDSTNERTVVSDDYELITWEDWQTIVANHEESLHPNAIITGVPDADGDISVDLMDTLWENENPTSSFTAQNIELSSGDYDLRLIIYRWSATSDTNLSVIAKKGQGFAMLIPTNGGSPSTARNYERYATYTDATHYAVADCFYNGGTTSNNNAIPIVIYGIKTTASVKVSAIAENVKASVEYSTSEQLIGKWIDGSDLYEKTVDFGALPNNTTKSVAHGISGLKMIADISGVAYGTGVSYLPLPFVSGTGTLTQFIQIIVDDTNIQVLAGMDRSNRNAYITLRYTKNS